MSNHYCISNPCPICMAGKEFPPDRFTFETPSGPFIGDAAADLRDAFIKGYTRGQQDARSVAHPPTSELVEAGNRLREHLAAYDDGGTPLSESCKAWDAALAHPKEVAPTVEKIMEAINDVLQDSYGDDVLDWIERSAYRDKDSGITQRITAKLTTP